MKSLQADFFKVMKEGAIQTRFRYFTKAVISLSKSMTGIFRSIRWLILTKKFGKALSNH